MNAMVQNHPQYRATSEAAYRSKDTTIYGSMILFFSLIIFAYFFPFDHEVLRWTQTPDENNVYHQFKSYGHYGWVCWLEHVSKMFLVILLLPVGLFFVVRAMIVPIHPRRQDLFFWRAPEDRYFWGIWWQIENAGKKFLYLDGVASMEVSEVHFQSESRLRELAMRIVIAEWELRVAKEGGLQTQSAEIFEGGIEQKRQELVETYEALLAEGMVTDKGSNPRKHYLGEATYRLRAA